MAPIKKLLLFHSVITFAAGVVLIIIPGAVPHTVNIQLQKNQYLLCYFLGAAEIALAYLSFFSGKINNPDTLKIICRTFIIFHATTALLELYALLQGISNKILINTLLRIIIVFLFYYYGIYKTRLSRYIE